MTILLGCVRADVRFSSPKKGCPDYVAYVLSTAIQTIGSEDITKTHAVVARCCRVTKAV